MANEVNRREFLVRTAAVAGATTGAALLQACAPVTAPAAEEGAGPQMAEPVKLTLWQGSWLWDEYFPTIGTKMEAAGISPKVEVDNPPIGWDELYAKYWLAGEAGVFPDLIWAAPDMMVRSLNNDAWLPIPEEAISYDWIKESFIQESIDQLLVDGSYYLICWEMATMALQVNRSILAEAGFDSEPTNFDEFLEMAKASVNKDGDKVLRSGFGIHGVKDIYRDILQSMGGEHLTDLFGTEIPFNNELGWEAWELLADFERKHDVLHFKFGKGLGWTGQTYVQGFSAFGWTSAAVNNELEANVQDVETGTTSARHCMPQIGPDGYRLGIAPNWGMVVTSATAEEKRDAAWQVYKYGLTKENLLDYISYTNTPPTHVEIAAMGADAFQGDRAAQYAVELADAICCGKVFALPPDIPLWDSVHETIYEKIVFDGMSAQDAMASEMSTLEKALQVS